MKKEWLLLLTLILIAFALRLLMLGEQSLWYDESVSWMLSQMQLPALIEWTAADIQPPLYYLLLWLTTFNSVFNDSEWALRFPSALFGVLSVPLIYTLTRRLFPKLPLAPLLSALILTCSPLMIYYSQEARMYTLLTFEAMLSSYLLLKILHPKPSESSRRFLGLMGLAWLYPIVSAAALYTHYFAAFLLIAHALYALYILWQKQVTKQTQAVKTLLLHLLLGFGGTLLLFAPWLPTLLARLGDDPSYWPGVLKVDEVIRKILISFTVGETVFEQTGTGLALTYFGFLGLGFVFLGLTARRQNTPPKTSPKNSIIFLLLWLLLPILLTLLLSYQAPKFNVRYTLLSWSALALLSSYLLASLLQKPQTNQKNPPTPSLTLLGITPYIAPTLALIFIIFILTSATFSLTNWFTDPRFSKADFKAVAQFIRERKTPAETVLLSSGHLFPVFAYYYGWEDWTPLPWMLRLDVNTITNLNIATNIAEAIADQQGVWLVTWQDEVIDPQQVVPFWLDLLGERPHDAGDFWRVGLEHWQLDPDKFDILAASPIKRPAIFDPEAYPQTDVLNPETSYNFANQIDLVGMTQLNDTHMVLFWRPRQPLPDNLSLTLKLTDKEGFSWSRKTLIGRPGAYLYPPSRWPVGEIVITHHQLPWQIGTPPGLYIAEIGLGTTAATDLLPTDTPTPFTGWDILDQQSRPQRRTALIDFVNLAHLIEPESGPLPMVTDPVVDMLPIIGMRRSILPQKSAQPGDRILLAALWQAGEYNLDNLSLVFDLVDAAGQTHPHIGASFTPSREYNLPRWKIGATVLGQYWLDIPPETAPGPATLQLHLINVSGYPYDEVFTFDTLEILPTERNFTPPKKFDMPLKADFSGQTTLLGVDCPQVCQTGPGETVTLTLYWRSDSPTNTSYTIFTHLLDSNETVLINADHVPQKITPAWVPNEIITDPITLTLPPDLPPGSYPLEVGLYDATDPAFPRLPLLDGQTRIILPQTLIVE